MNDDLRTLLNDVAQGRIAPAAAAQLIDDLPPAAPDEAPARPSEPSQPAAPQRPTEAAEGPVQLVRVTSSARPVRLVGDPTVDTVTVDGPHVVRREGSTLRIDAAPLAGDAAPGSYRYERKSGLSRWLGQATLVGVRLTVRVNPDLAVEAEVTAGSLELLALRGPIDFSVTAGSVRATDCTGPFNGAVRAGSARLDVRPTAGRSLVRVESGSVELRLQPGSDVRVTGRADLGEIKVTSAAGHNQILNGGDLQDVVLGAGSAVFELQVAMGSAKVRLP